MAEKIVRIGGACAGWGDGMLAVPQLVQGGNLDYLIFDFLSEFFLPVMGRMPYFFGSSFSEAELMQ